MPDAVWKKRRRERPCSRAMLSAMSISRASTCFCCGVCGEGRYSSLETTWVGTGDGKAASSAPSNWFSSSSFRNACTDTNPAGGKTALSLADDRHGVLSDLAILGQDG